MVFSGDGSQARNRLRLVLGFLCFFCMYCFVSMFFCVIPMGFCMRRFDSMFVYFLCCGFDGLLYV